MSIPIAVQIYLLAAVVSLGVALLIHLLVRVLEASEHHHPISLASPHKAEPPAAGVTPEQVAAIAGALSEVLGQHRIVRIEPAVSGRSWISGARVAQHDSHHLVRTPGRTPNQ